MGEMFKLQASDLLRLKKFYKNAPKQFHKATANLLNTMAFGTRKEVLKTIHSRMNIRNQTFVVSKVRVKTARAFRSTKNQESKVFSIRSPRFSGWEEQETGKKTTRSKVSTKLGRGGSQKGQIKPRFRMKRSYIDESFYHGKSNSQRVGNMLRSLKERKYKKPFVIKKHKKYKPGLYKLHRKKVRRLQEFKSKRVQPKRIKWMSIARKNYLKKMNLRKEWGKSITRVMKY